MGGFKAVIFDLDGTLLNTVEDLAYAMNTVLAKNNFPVHLVQDYRFFVGGGLTNLVYQTIPVDKRKPEIINVVQEDVAREYARCIDTKTKPYEGIYELFDGLTARDIPMAILSNKPHQFMAETVNTHFAKWGFHIVFGARVGVPIKPHPESALEIADILGLKPHEIVYVGDTDVDMRTAISAGMYPVGVAWGFRGEAELLANGAKQIIYHPTELLKLF